MTSALGDGAAEMSASMMNEMPLASIVSFGMMAEDQLESLVMELNRQT
jgi:hypothetical protein